MAVIGLDVGTTGCKATVVDVTGQTMCQNYCEYDLFLPREGWVEIDPEIVWQAARKVLISTTNMCNHPLTSMAIASFGEAAVLLDSGGKALGNSIFYTDERGYEYVDALAEEFGRKYIEDVTGMPLNGMYTLPKLLWVKEHMPDIYNRINMVLPYAGFIAWKLTGRNTIDLSLASRMLLFNRHTGQWDRDLLEYAGLAVDQLPKPVPSGRPVGRINANVAEELGLPPYLIVVSGGHDQVVAALGAGAVKPGQAADGIGSAECITAVLPDDIPMDGLLQHHICAEPYTIEGKNLALMFNNTAGAALKWFRNQMTPELHAQCRSEGRSAYTILDRGLGDNPSPLLFMPHLAGSGTPHMDMNATGILCGLTLGSTRADIYRAIIEGTNYEMRYNLDLLASCGMRVDTVTAVGGGASSPAALQIKADIFGFSVRTLKNPQSGNIGLAMLCHIAEGRFACVEDAVAALVRTDRTFQPNTSKGAAYDEKYMQYRRMYEVEKSIYRRKNN